MVKKDTVPAKSCLAQVYGSVNYQDCFSKKISVQSSMSPAGLFQDMFFPVPGWIKTLMNIRNWIVPFFGLKAVSGNSNAVKKRDEDLTVGDFIGFFEIVSMEEHEIVVSANDRHLDSSFSLLIAGEGAQKTVFLTSVVTTKEWFGDVYMFVIAPFHRLIVCHLLNRLT
ncbi:MAG: DUF2867 domain-containing protein [Sneathiella sp.]|nr:DUF2867 domain-containing protein [Sneathiella sp.]